jgi:predicted GNAT superfamily acetyltransferase
MADAWARAHEAARAAGVELRPIGSVADAGPIGGVIAATWGEQPIGPEIVRALAASGNTPFGAFDGDRLIGFVLGWAGVDGEGLHVHSHMLATLPERRHAGVGYALKLAQRAQALDAGIPFVRWTFDPLVARNAYFNLAKLGAIADRFERDYYGAMSDDLNRGDRTDRFTVRWELGPDPADRQAASATADAPVALRRVGPEERPSPSLASGASADVVAVEIPADYAALRAADLDLARRWRDAVAEAVERCLARGMVASGFDRVRSAYLLTTAERA